MIQLMNSVYELSPTIQMSLFGDKPAATDQLKPADQSSKLFIDSLRESRCLNLRQHESNSLILSSLENAEQMPFVCIQGPPGTGKTETILSTISSLLFQSNYGNEYLRTEYNPDLYTGRLLYRKSGEFSILICTASNNAISNIQQKIESNGLPVPNNRKRLNINVTRVYAHSLSITSQEDHSSLNNKIRHIQEDPYHKDNGRNRKSLGKTIMERSVVVLATLSTACSMDLADTSNFDGIIVDEATQATEPDIVSCLIASTKKTSRVPTIVLVGYQKQLPPVIKCSRDISTSIFHRLRFDYSLFERLLEENRCPSTMLQLQYRSHPLISRIHSELFYNKQLVDGLRSDFYQRKFNYLYSHNSFGKPVMFLDTASNAFEKREQDRFINKYEALILLSVLQSFNDMLIGSDQRRKFSFGIITPYRQQTGYLQHLLNQNPLPHINVTAGTVDSMQGQERDVILFSTVRSNDSRNLGFINDKRRMNVAISRAKAILIFVGDSKTICTDTIFHQLVTYCRR